MLVAGGLSRLIFAARVTLMRICVTGRQSALMDWLLPGTRTASSLSSYVCARLVLRGRWAVRTINDWTIGLAGGLTALLVLALDGPGRSGGRRRRQGLGGAWIGPRRRWGGT